jgi:hypothetical protein
LGSLERRYLAILGVEEHHILGVCPFSKGKDTLPWEVAEFEHVEAVASSSIAGTPYQHIVEIELQLFPRWGQAKDTCREHDAGHHGG